MANEMLGPILLTIHNLTYYQRLVADARKAIEEDRFVEFKQRDHYPSQNLERKSSRAG